MMACLNSILRERAMFAPEICAVLFDAVGTLINPHPPAAQVYAEVGTRFGSCRTPEVIAPRFAAAFREEEQIDHAAGLRTSEARERERWRRIVGRVLDDVADAEGCFQELFDHFARPDSWRIDPEATATLQALAARGYRLGLASNYDSRLRRVVAGLPDLSPLQHLVISSEVGWRKPAPEFYAALSRQVGLEAGQILYVGDDLVNDYLGARACGLPALLYDPDGRATVPFQRVGHLRDLTDPPRQFPSLAAAPPCPHGPRHTGN
jgi:putative hydrolase of the HAD superfamily